MRVYICSENPEKPSSPPKWWAGIRMWHTNSRYNEPPRANFKMFWHENIQLQNAETADGDKED